jgi:hypothetical protein
VIEERNAQDSCPGRITGGREMMKIVLLVLSLLILLTAYVGNGVASDLRCGSRLVFIGDYRYDVLQKCGEPANVETWEEVHIRRDLLLSSPLTREQELFLRSPFAKKLVIVEEWQYNFGQSQFMRYLRFENGRLRRITTGDYGY